MLFRSVAINLILLFSVVEMSGCGQTGTSGQVSLAKLNVLPQNSIILVGQTQQFRALGYNSSDVLIFTPLSQWRLTGVGTISASGLYYAGNEPGMATIEASLNGITRNTTIEVAYFSAPKISWLIIPKTSQEVTSGEEFWIGGENFYSKAGNSSVMVGSKEAEITSWGTCQIKCKVPFGIYSGFNNVKVVSRGLTSNTEQIMVVNPVIDDISLHHGSVWSKVTIHGRYLGDLGYYNMDDYVNSSVEVNGVVVSGYPTWSDTSITFKVPAGATSGNIVVYKNNVPSNGLYFTVEATPSTGEYSLGEYGTMCFLEIAPNGSPRAGYYLWATGVRSASWNGNGWSFETVDTSNSFYDLAMSLTSTNIPMFTYIKSSDEKLRFAAKNPSWQINEFSRAYECALAIDRDQQPHIVYQNLRLYYEHYDSDGWHVSTVDASSINSDFKPSIALRSNGRPAIFYYDTNNQSFKYADYDGSSWQIETVEATTNDGSTYLIFDGDDNPWVAYYRGAELVYAKKSGGSWQGQVVENTGFSNFYGKLSMAIDGSGNPVICYFAKDGGKVILKVGAFNGSSWLITSIKQADFGSYPNNYACSMRIVDNKYRIISNVEGVLVYYVQ